MSLETMLYSLKSYEKISLVLQVQSSQSDELQCS